MYFFKKSYTLKIKLLATTRDFSGSVLLPHTLFPSLQPSPLRTWHSGTHGTISTRALQRGDTPQGWLALHGPSYVTRALLIQDSWRFSSQLRAQFNTCLRYILVSKSQRQFRKVQETNLHKGSGLHCLELIFFSGYVTSSTCSGAANFIFVLPKSFGHP